MDDPGWDLWDAKRVRTALWPSSKNWPDGDELWPDVAIAPPGERRFDLAPIRASDVEPDPGPLWVTYWAWAAGTPFVKIGRTRYQAGGDGVWRGKAELAERRIREWSTGCMYPVILIRVNLDDAEHEGVEHALRTQARVTPEREWFDLRRL
jgi:hypothetical protein